MKGLARAPARQQQLPHVSPGLNEQAQTAPDVVPEGPIQRKALPGAGAPVPASNASAGRSGGWGGVDLNGGEWGGSDDGALGVGGFALQRKGAGGTAPGAGEAVARASQSGGAPLASGIRDKAEGSLGMDLSGVRVHTGGQAADAAASVNARAYTTGNDVTFGAGQYQPGTAGGDSLIAHELVHVAQQSSGGSAVQAASSISRSGEGAEVEADAGAQAIVSGQAFSPRQQPASLARTENLNGNPAERSNAAGPTTTHRSPTLQDAINAPTTDAATDEARATNVQVVANRDNPLHLEPPETPAPDRVYEESSEQTSPPPVGYTTVSSIRGSVGQPMVEQEADKSIFINGRPSADDVQQMSIGDCYFLAALQSVLSRDPGKIPAMMSADGNGGASVTFWRRQEHESTFWESLVGGPDYDYIPVSVSVNDELAVNIVNNRVHGAQLRCAESPKAVDYWSQVDGERLEVHRKDTFECARWAPLMEKAYARFAQQHGQYGGARDGHAAGGSGYDAIDGGVSMYTYSVFYGAEADQSSTDVHRENITWAPGSNVLASNPRVVDQLLLLVGRPAEAGPTETDAPIVVASAFVDALIPRLKAAITTAQGDADWANLGAPRQAQVAAVLAAINAWEVMPNDPPAPAPQPKATAKRAIGTACSTAALPGPVNAGGLAAVQSVIPSFVQFGQGHFDVNATDKPRLNQAGTLLSTTPQPEMEVDLVGHSSSEGSEESNQLLSQQRADAVAAEIRAGGDVSAHDLQVSAVGEAGADSTADWRRVDIDVEAQQGSNALHADTRSRPMREMMDLMLDLKNIGTDASPGQRNIYGDHAYQVVSVSFVNTAGDQVPLQTVASADRPAMFPQVDAFQSRVGLRNPHHNNEPDRQGDGQPTHAGDGAPSGPQADGIFNMSVDEFFRNYNAVDTGVFPRTGA